MTRAQFRAAMFVSIMISMPLMAAWDMSADPATASSRWLWAFIVIVMMVLSILISEPIADLWNPFRAIDDAVAYCQRTSGPASHRAIRWITRQARRYDDDRLVVWLTSGCPIRAPIAAGELQRRHGGQPSGPSAPAGTTAA